LEITFGNFGVLMAKCDIGKNAGRDECTDRRVSSTKRGWGVVDQKIG
jgi:hypothetical protein